MQPTSSHYRPELDGLRAVAVLAVLLFHLEAAWLPGGFAGVDVFFVLSGYLVTSIILRDRGAGRFKFRTFYQRRIARIFPAFLTMSLVTLVAARGLYSSWDYAFTASAFSAAMLSMANLHLLHAGDYFQLSADAQPLLHCWSLSLEEQFYLIFPVFFILILKCAPRYRLVLMAVPAAVSFAVCLYLTGARPVSAFYLLPSRAWELLAGGLTALLMNGNAAASLSSVGGFRRGSFRFPEISGLISLGLILLSFVFLDPGHGFPGWQAVLPVLGTVGLIWSGRTGWAGHFLSGKYLTAVGRLSYSLYLWHWPVFSMVDYSLLQESTATRIVWKVMFTGLAAVLCYRFIEKPARAALNQPHRRGPVFLFFALPVIALVPLTTAITDRHYLDTADSTPGAFVFSRPKPQGMVALMGDSHASMYAGMVRDLAASEGLDFLFLGAAGKDPLAPASGQEPSPLHMANLEVIRRRKPTHLILTCHWMYKLGRDPERLALTIKALQPHAGHLILLTQPPLLPDSASRAAQRAGLRAPFFEDPVVATTRHRLNDFVKSLAGPEVTVIDMDPWFFDKDGALITTNSDGNPLFHDSAHLSQFGTARVKEAVAAALVP